MAVFESYGISKTEKVTPTKIGTLTHICMNFLSRFRLIKFFGDHGQSMVQKENLAIFESYGISETEKVTPTIIGVHAYYINTYLHEFFEPILID